MKLWMINLVLYSGQLAIVALAAWLVSLAPAMRAPRTAHRHWRLSLLASLLLPLLSFWIPVLPVGVGDVTVTLGPAVAGGAASSDWSNAAAGALIIGAGLLALRLGVSLLRIRRWVREARPIASNIRISDRVKGPVTFGWPRAVMLAPPEYLAMPEPQRRAIDIHEKLHAERRDWLHLLGEELVRCVLWFHPAIWLVLSRIHLTREQVVDQAAVEITGDRETYLNALLAVAGLRTEFAFTAAPSFLHKGHLAARVAAIVERPGPATRSMAVAAALILIAACAASASMLPLRLPAKPAALRIGGNRQSQKLVRHVRPAYPAEAKAARIQGTVRLAVTVDSRGRVRDISTIAGHPLLVPASIEAVRQWQYSATYLNGLPVEVTTQVDVNYTLEK